MGQALGLSIGDFSAVFVAFGPAKETERKKERTLQKFGALVTQLVARHRALYMAMYKYYRVGR